MNITSDQIVVIVSALCAALTFAAIALPLLKRSEKKDRMRAVIERKRKTLFEAQRETLLNKEAGKSVSAQESLATFYKMQKIFGAHGEKIRDRLLQAGMRSPTAPAKYLISQLILPAILAGFAMIILSNIEKELSDLLIFLIIGGAIVFGFMLPSILVKNTAIKRVEELNLSFPDALDMLLICVQGGIGLEQAVDRVSHEMMVHAPTLGEELGLLSAEMAMLSDRRQALSDFGRRVGGHGKSFATALIQADQYGTSVSQALRTMSDELREIRMANAEQKAAALPPKLTVPMILFFLPALFVVILAPAGIEATATF